ncbi:MAG: peptidyl-prolyl cis-trans isomerase [Bacteroidaceae bacterium]|nr:peptidyl-prolyl cis-trans isomerase [Bacteroidaceae bacterium]
MIARLLNILTILIVSSSMLLVSCEEQISHKGKTPLLSIGKDFLYKEDVEHFISVNTPAADSARLVNEYVQRWVEDALFYRMARRNVRDTNEVERLVENYRRSLLLNIYQDRLIAQRLLREVSDADVARFYEQNKELFLLEAPMVQGLFLKVSNKAAKLSSVRKWISDAAPEDIENLEKYCLTNAIAYDYFIDGWRTLDAISARMPVTSDALLNSLQRDNLVEVSDTGAVYILNVTTLLNKGEQKPLDLASDEIRSLLINSMKTNFIKEAKRDLLRQALETKDIKFYDKEMSDVLIPDIVQPNDLKQ